MMSYGHAPKKVDRRIRRTQRLLADALIDLMLEHSYNAVSIKDITERANIAYATFFRHYKDKDELLLAILGSIIEEMKSLLGQARDSSPEAQGLMLFQTIEKNARLYLALLSSEGSPKLRARVQKMVIAEFMRAFPATLDNSIPTEILANHIMVTTIGLIAWWLTNAMPYPPEKMATIYAELVVRSTQHIITPKSTNNSKRPIRPTQTDE